MYDGSTVHSVRLGQCFARRFLLMQIVQLHPHHLTCCMEVLPVSIDRFLGLRPPFSPQVPGSCASHLIRAALWKFGQSFAVGPVSRPSAETTHWSTIIPSQTLPICVWCDLDNVEPLVDMIRLCYFKGIP
ncbi:hypothetical protein PAXRUDRAFT_408160 [Paxillus rubicundulus Ve08.2h10]|uniref:Uncharacterized protein n=1 Tax=Paxillus rubicundulus Ve08.2h10 TaxID=930991 RepID=A0A0D0DCW6_9AGAM|nr:hypothetical protein PAXRUDRAFT_408160 [Paxillus rubicundulus Ve08.2h10]